LIVELKSDGFSGWRSHFNPYYHYRYNDAADLEKIRPVIEATTDSQNFWTKIHPYLQNNMFALCASMWLHGLV
jgi:hypothetical protein